MGLWDRLRRTFAEKPAPTPEDVFAEEFTAEARKHPGVERVERSAKEHFTLLVWSSGSGSPTRMYLGNVFQETREVPPEERVARIRAALSIVGREGETPTWEEAQDLLVPLVRMATLGLGVPAKVLAHRPFLPFLRLYAGLDRGETFAYVNQDQVQEWQVDAAKVFDAAATTLAGHVLDSDVEAFDRDAAYSIWHVTRDDTYESSRLALPDFLASFRDKVEGTPIAVVPTRSTLVVSGDGHPDAIARVARHAEKEFLAAPRPISPAVYTVGPDGRVVPFHVPPSHPHHHLVERGHRVLAATCYADQKEALEKQHQGDGTDVFVATLGIFSDKATGETTTYATMAEDVDTLLPEADLIALAETDEDGWRGMVPWATVFKLARECFEKDASLDPPRWRVVGWPERVVIEKLKALAVM